MPGVQLRFGARSCRQRLQQPARHPAHQQGAAGGQTFDRRADRLRAFGTIEERSGGDPLATFKKAMDNVRPTLEVKPKRVGGATYQVPIEVNSRRSTTLAIRWLVGFSRKRREKTMAERLANEILDAANNTGASVKRRETCTRWPNRTGLLALPLVGSATGLGPARSTAEDEDRTATWPPSPSRCQDPEHRDHGPYRRR